jgi:hypothetical protein
VSPPAGKGEHPPPLIPARANIASPAEQPPPGGVRRAIVDSDKDSPRLLKPFTKAALVASLLLGTSALAQAQTHQGTAAAPAGPAASPAPAAPAETQAEPQKAEPHKAGTTKSSEADTTKPHQPGATKSSEVSGHGNSTVESTPGHTSGHPDRATSGSSTETGKTPTNDAGAGGNKAEASSPASATATVNMTTTQKTEIHNTIINNRSAPRATNININLAVGVAVPSAVQFAPLPPNIVTIEPAWRGYYYFLYGEEIVIIEPGTRRIIAILVA